MPAKPDMAWRTNRPNRPSSDARKEAVIGSVDLAPAKPGELLVNQRVVCVEKLAPSSIAELDGFSRGIDDIGKEDGGENVIDVAPRPCARQKFLDLFEDRVVVAEERIVRPPGRGEDAARKYTYELSTLHYSIT